MNLTSSPARGAQTPAAVDPQEIEDSFLGDFEFAYEQASAARREVTAAGIAMIGHVIRMALPTATHMSVRAEGLALTAVRAADDILWAKGAELPGHTLRDVNAFLTDVLTFGRDQEVLTDLGWTEDGHRTGVFSIAFPAAP